MAFDWKNFAKGIERTTGMVQGTIMQAYQQEKENEEWQRRQMINEGRMVRLEQMRFKNQKAAAESAARLQNDLTLGRQEDIMRLQSKLALYDNSFEVMSLYEDPENPFGRVVYGDKKQKLEKGILFDDQDRKDIEEHLPQQVAMKIYDLEQQERVRQDKYTQDQSRINAIAERYRTLGEKEQDVAARMKRAQMDEEKVSRNKQILKYDTDIKKLRDKQFKIEQTLLKEQSKPKPNEKLIESYSTQLATVQKEAEALDLEKMAFMEKAAGISRTESTYQPTKEEQAELTRLGLTYEEAKAMYEKSKK